MKIAKADLLLRVYDVELLATPSVKLSYIRRAGVIMKRGAAAAATAAAQVNREGGEKCVRGRIRGRTRRTDERPNNGSMSVSQSVSRARIVFSFVVNRSSSSSPVTASCEVRLLRRPLLLQILDKEGRLRSR